MASISIIRYHQVDVDTTGIPLSLAFELGELAHLISDIEHIDQTQFTVNIACLSPSEREHRYHLVVNGPKEMLDRLVCNPAFAFRWLGTEVNAWLRSRVVS